MQLKVVQTCLFLPVLTRAFLSAVPAPIRPLSLVPRPKEFSIPLGGLSNAVLQERFPLKITQLDHSRMTPDRESDAHPLKSHDRELVRAFQAEFEKWAKDGNSGCFISLLTQHAERTETLVFLTKNHVLNQVVLRGDQQLVDLLIQIGVDVTKPDAVGNQSIHYAQYQSNPHITQILLRHGADPNTTNHQGQTPLHIAAAAERADHCAVLMTHGANIAVKDTEGNTPLDYIKSPELLQFILNKNWSSPAVGGKGKSPLLDFNLSQKVLSEADIQQIALLTLNTDLNYIDQKVFDKSPVKALVDRTLDLNSYAKLCGELERLLVAESQGRGLNGRKTMNALIMMHYASKPAISQLMTFDKRALSQAYLEFMHDAVESIGKEGRVPKDQAAKLAKLALKENPTLEDTDYKRQILLKTTSVTDLVAIISACNEEAKSLNAGKSEECVKRNELAAFKTIDTAANMLVSRSAPLPLLLIGLLFAYIKLMFQPEDYTW